MSAVPEVPRTPETKLKRADAYAKLVNVAIASQDPRIQDGVTNILKQSILAGQLPDRDALELYGRSMASPRSPYSQERVDAAYEKLRAAKPGSRVGIFSPGELYTGIIRQSPRITFGRRYPDTLQPQFDDFLTFYSNIEQSINPENMNPTFITISFEPRGYEVGSVAIVERYKKEMKEPSFKSDAVSSDDYPTIVRRKLDYSRAIMAVEGVATDDEIETMQQQALADAEAFMAMTLMDHIRTSYGSEKISEDTFFKEVANEHVLGDLLRAYIMFVPDRAARLAKAYSEGNPLQHVEGYQEYVDAGAEKALNILRQLLSAAIDAHLFNSKKGRNHLLTKVEFIRSVRRQERHNARKALSSLALQQVE